ncbi:MAG: adenylate/guanylate cyclase domain-containing protein [Alphaproteobacteria bacterium]
MADSPGLLARLSGAADEAALPARVRQVIAAQQLRGEQLIGWAQLVVGLTWTALYLAAPKTFEDSQTIMAFGFAFGPVPVALAAYVAITAMRLWLTYRGIAPAWLLMGSVVLDMVLLLGLIWSFHLQYMQPAAFYLKAPTLLYVFIFIALRALRFSAAYVMLAGAVAAVGWLVLVYYAMATAEQDMGVTRDYIAYMTSSAVLLGAEFDKVITILLTTVILAVAILRARGLLVRSVAEGAAASELSRFFAPEIARQITQAEHRIQPGQGEKRRSAILMADIRGFTALSKRVEPNALMTLLADYERRMVGVIQAHGGSIDKFMGDGILATFGAAVRTDTYAADALAAVRALGQAAEAWQADLVARGEEPLQVNFAVAAGEVVFGAIGDADRLEFTVIGDAVNLAAKLEKANKDQAVKALTTAETLAIAERQGYRAASPHETRPASTVDGVAAPVDLVVLLV